MIMTTCPTFTCLLPPCGKRGNLIQWDVTLMNWVESDHTEQVLASLSVRLCSLDV